MYDGGTQTTMCESIAGLSDDGAVRISPAEASKLGVDTGATVRLSSQRASVEGKVIVDDHISAGVAAVAHNHAGLDVRSLIAIGDLVTDIRIETV
jgi:predicted molibdopterin-dependent oxidoreductase YjgC